MPSSPGDKNRQPQPSIPVVGSAENLVGRVSHNFESLKVWPIHSFSANRSQKLSYTFFFSKLVKVLRDQGLGKYCDPEFVRAASREMQEAMDMTPEEFDAAAHQLLTAEAEGKLSGPLRLPGMGGAIGDMSGDTGWGDDDESVPLRSPAATLPGAPSHFQAPSQGGNPAAPSRPRRGRGEPEPGSRM